MRILLDGTDVLHKYRQRKGVIKLRLLLDYDGSLPSFAVVTEGKHRELHTGNVASQCCDALDPASTGGYTHRPVWPDDQR
jgi:hypothetical protein